LGALLVFKQALRQTEGFLQSLIDLMKLDLKAPDYSTMSRRSNGLKVPPAERRSGESLTLVVNSTGLKVYGQGEWDAAKHGLKRRRGWYKLHLGIAEETLDVVAHTLTTEAVGDSTEVPNLLGQLETGVDEFIGDGR
jgi:hypothetical protein